MNRMFKNIILFAALFLVTNAALAQVVVIQNSTTTKNQSGMADVILTVNNWINEYKIPSEQTVQAVVPSQANKVRFVVDFYLNKKKLDTHHCDHWIYFNGTTHPTLRITSNTNPIDETSHIICEIR